LLGGAGAALVEGGRRATTRKPLGSDRLGFPAARYATLRTGTDIDTRIR
jgi:hypothetical protein